MMLLHQAMGQRRAGRLHRNKSESARTLEAFPRLLRSCESTYLALWPEFSTRVKGDIPGQAPQPVAPSQSKMPSSWPRP